MIIQTRQHIMRISEQQAKKLQQKGKKDDKARAKDDKAKEEKEKIDEVDEAEENDDKDESSSSEGGESKRSQRSKQLSKKKRGVRLGKGGNFTLDEILEKLQNFETWENFEVPKLKNQVKALEEQQANDVKQLHLKLQSQGKELCSYMENLHKDVLNFVQQKKDEKQQMFSDLQICLKKQDLAS